MKKQFKFGKSIAVKDELRAADSILYSQSKHGTELLRYEMQAYEELGIPGELGKNSELPIQIDATLTLKNESQIHPVRFGQTSCTDWRSKQARVFTNNRMFY